MRYSQDGRKRVLDFIAAGGSKAEASRRFGVSRRCIYNWLDAANPLTYENRDLVILIGLIQKHSQHMSKRFQTAP